MKKIESIFLYVLIFFLPFNVKKFILNPFGVEPLTEFSAIFLYLSDILIVSILFLWLIRIIKTKQFQVNKPPLWSYFLILFIVSLFSSLILSQNLTLNIYFLIRFLLSIGLFVYLMNNLKKNLLLNVIKIISLGGLAQSLIALGQFIKQSSLGLKYLGESVINGALPGIAKINIGNIKFIRSYGTFSHPNILATFILFALYCSVYLVLKKKGAFIFVIPFLALGLILTFSRSVLFFGSSSLIVFLIFVFIKKKKKESLISLSAFLISLIILTIPFIPFFSQRINISPSNQAVSARFFYNESAIEIIKKSPLIGIGLGSFSFKLNTIYPDLENWQYQPAHNIYLLLISEVGVLGFLMFILFIYFLLQVNLSKNKTYNLEYFIFYILFFVFLCVGFFDHYFFTINQGMLLFWLVLGIIARKQYNENLDF